MSEHKVPAVFGALHAVMREIGVIGKENTNSFQKYNFRSVAQAMASLQPLLIKHNLIAIPHYDSPVLHEQEKGYTATVRLSLQFISTVDGSDVMAQVPGQGADAGDKALAKALAGAFKYAVFQTFCVPEEGVDAEFASPEVKAKPKAKPVQNLKDILG